MRSGTVQGYNAKVAYVTNKSSLDTFYPVRVLYYKLPRCSCTKVTAIRRHRGKWESLATEGKELVTVRRGITEASSLARVSKREGIILSICATTLKRAGAGSGHMS